MPADRESNCLGMLVNRNRWTAIRCVGTRVVVTDMGNNQALLWTFCGIGG
jgi:hypothetical protein